MKKAYLKSVLILCLLALAACGKKAEEEPLYYNVQVESSGQLEELESGQFLLGQQYYHGEPVSLMAETAAGETADGGDLSLRPMDVYLRSAGGDKQLLMGGVSEEYLCRGGWYLDEKGRCFVRMSTGVTRLDGDGKPLYHSSLSDIVLDMCCTEGDRILLLTRKTDGGRLLVSLDPDTGDTSPMENISLDSVRAYISSLGNDLLLLDNSGIWQIDLKKGTKEQKLSFQGTTFSIEKSNVSDFRFDGEGADILWDSGRSERLALTDIHSGKEIITVRTAYPNVLKEMLNLFNQSSDTYYAVLEESGIDLRKVLPWNDQVTAFQTETNLKLSSGKAADIICSDALFDDKSSYMEKGVFTDLAPLMEAAGIREEDYFQAAFGQWRDGNKIYGITPYMSAFEWTLDKTVLNGREELTIETFVDALLELEEDRCFFESWDSVRVLDYFLGGSCDLWGMVDWEKGTCDFHGELFSRMLLAAKRCGSDQARQYPPLINGSRSTYNNIYYAFDTSEKLEAENRIPLGVFFDDRNHPLFQVDNGESIVMGVNAASEHVEGAMQLLAFLLGEEAQSAIEFYPILGSSGIYPVNKSVFDRQAQEEREHVTITGSGGSWSGRFFGKEHGGNIVLSEQVVTELRQLLSEARCTPYTIRPLRSIIGEEAAYYFNGSKSMEDVIAVIQNRVQLYLDEH